MKGAPFLPKVSKRLEFGVEPPYILKALLSTTRDECTLNVTSCHSSIAASVRILRKKKEDEIHWPAIFGIIKRKRSRSAM